MAEKTLADKVLRGFSIVKTEKAFIRVPRLKIANTNQKPLNKKTATKTKTDGIPVSSLISILIKSVVESSKGKRKEDVKSDGVKSYKAIKGDFADTNGGYGTISNGYGNAPQKSYIDYGKLFSYLGKFRAKNPYENMAEHSSSLNKASEDSFALISPEVMEKGKTYVRYFHPTVAMIDKTSLVPVAGMNSAEWEEFKNLMRFDPVLYLLKIKTA